LYRDFDFNQLKTIQTCSLGTHAPKKAAKAIQTSSMRTNAPKTLQKKNYKYNAITTPSPFMVSSCKIYLQIQGLFDFSSKRNYHHLKEFDIINAPKTLQKKNYMRTDVPENHPV
jgi:hypothetical protein